ncbi:MAG: hypothetical protein NXI27_11625 [Alphaproteobacteria bacterium]|nr:hypothetical protein [Alphaproteobacteria bacterium]
MSISVRTAQLSDLDTVVELLIADAKRREAADPIFWKVKPAPRDKIYPAVRAFMEIEHRAFHQALLLAETGRKTIGIAHTMILPVPPIYAGGAYGPPGLILEDCYVTEDAPAGAWQALIEAAEADLVQAGAETLLGQSAVGRVLEKEYEKRGYEPLTLYLAKTGLRQAGNLPDIRAAEDSDIEDIVTASAEHRRILDDLNVFWKPSSDANARFAAWMRKSLTLADHDMFVSSSDGEFNGYAISQPVTHMHFPIPHDISAVGKIDDYYHVDTADPTALPDDAKGASDLLLAAEAALAARGNNAAFVVCPAAWTSKRKMLEAAGYSNAMTWFKKRPSH